MDSLFCGSQPIPSTTVPEEALRAGPLRLWDMPVICWHLSKMLSFFLAPQDVPGSSLLPRPCKVSWSLPSRNSGWKPRSVGRVQVTARSVCSLIPYFDTVQHQAFRSHILVHVCAHAHTHTHILVKDSQGAGRLLPYPTPLDLGPGTSSVQPTCPDRFSPPPTRYPGDPGSRLLSLPALLIAILLITAATCY